MKRAKPGTNWFFVDESGNPTFYDRKGNLIVGQEGCSPILVLGFVETQQPEPSRQAVLNLQREVITDPYFEGVPSLARTAIAFHAKDDLPEVRYRVFKLLAGLDFKAQFVVARKIEKVFRNSFHARESEFYDHLVSQLFKNALHRFETNHIYFARRGSRVRQAPLWEAIRQGINRFERQWSTQVTTRVTVQAQTPQGEPCLSVIDYLNWAVYRAFTRGEMRYYRQIETKVSLLVDLYDTGRYPKNWYNKRNPFDINKITPL
ncbi:MAG: hypothetical protein RMJ52_05280 [Gemmataceae bacterium]|nr:hypothetical protein [Gemmataceae bacterium]